MIRISIVLGILSLGVYHVAASPSGKPRPDQPDATDESQIQPHILTVRVQNPDGEPVALGTVRVSRLSGAPPTVQSSQRSAVGPDGRIDFSLYPGTYSVAWNAKDNIKPLKVMLDGVPVSGYPKTVRLTPPRQPPTPERRKEKTRIVSVMVQEIGLEVTVTNRPRDALFVVEDPADKTVVGRIEDQSGSGVPDIRVDLYRGEALSCGSCGSSDRSGRFEVVVREFPVRVAPRDRSDVFDFLPADIVVTGPTDSLRFLATPNRKSKLRGRVVTADTEEPVSGASVRGQLSCTKEPIIDYESMMTNDEGRFALKCRPECTYTLSAWERHYIPSDQVVIEPEACDERPTLTLEVGGVLHGVIRDSSGTPMSRLPLAESQRSGSRLEGWTTDEVGHYRIPGMHPNWIQLIRVDYERSSPPDRWLYLSDPEESVPEGLLGPVFVVPDPPVAVQRDLVARRGGRLCWSDTPEPARVTVHLLVDDGTENRSARSPALNLTLSEVEDGLHCTPAIAPGRYRYLLEGQAGLAPSWHLDDGPDTGSRIVAVRDRTTKLPSLEDQPFGQIELEIPEGSVVGMDTPLVAEIADADQAGAPGVSSPSDARWFRVPPERFELGHLGEVVGNGREVELFSPSLQGIPVGRYHARLCVGSEPCPSTVMWFSLYPAEVQPDKFSRLQLFSSAAVLTVERPAVAWTRVGEKAQYTVVRGELSAFRRKHGDPDIAVRCLARGTSAMRIEDDDVPSPGEGYWYAVRATANQDKGTYNSGGIGQAFSRDGWLWSAEVSCTESFRPPSRPSQPPD
jgi:hypothetical protein